MRPGESIELWFKFLEQRGEWAHLAAIEENPQSKLVREHDFFHGDIDGIGTFLHLMEQYEKKELLLPELPTRSDPPVLVTFINFLRYLSRLPFYSQPWSLGPTDWKALQKPERPRAYAVRQLSRADTLKFWEHARRRKIGRHAYLLYHLNRALDPYHPEQKKWQRYWLIPVSLRSDFSTDFKANKAGFIDARITEVTTPESLHASMRKSLLRGEAYGGYAGITIGRFIGADLLKLLVMINDYIQVRTGVFTNLGNWKTKDGEHLGSNWYGLPPVIKSQPFGAMTGSMNEEQSLALVFHPLLTRSPELAKECLERWIEGLLSDSD